MATVRMQASPYQISTDDAKFPNISFAKLIIRIESGGSFKTYFTLDGTAPSASKADGFLDSGDAIEINGSEVKDSNLSNVRLLNITGDPKIFWRAT